MLIKPPHGVSLSHNKDPIFMFKNPARSAYRYGGVKWGAVMGTVMHREFRIGMVDSSSYSLITSPGQAGLHFRNGCHQDRQSGGLHILQVRLSAGMEPYIL
jgi:hypothetical protein